MLLCPLPPAGWQRWKQQDTWLLFTLWLSAATWYPGLLRSCAWVCVSCLLWPAPAQGGLRAFIHASHRETSSPGLLSGELDLAREDEANKCARHLRCLQALSAISTHPSIVKETLPLLLQHLCQLNKGNCQD